MSTQILTELPNIQVAGMDFDTTMSEIESIVNNNPNWKDNWSEFYDSEAGTMLTQIMSWITDNLSTKQDVLFNEMFLTTCQKDSSKIKHLKQIAYVPQFANAAKAAVRIDFNLATKDKINITPVRTADVSLRTGEICSFTAKNINGESANWEILKITDGKPDYLNSVILKSGDTSYETDTDGNTIYAMEGETHYEEFTTETTDGPYFDLSETDVAANSIQVYIKKSLKQCLEVSSFVSKDALDTTLSYPYVVEMNEDLTKRIRFGNDSILASSRLLPAGTTVSIFYRTTTGSLGNISPGFINTTITTKDQSDNNYSATVYNDLLGSGGTDAEDMDDAVLNGPLSLRTMDRAVTPDDYNILLNKNTTVFKTKTYTSTNQPDNFKSYYGRYINPQESFTFILLNKNYADVPTSEYNNFPWVTLTKDPRLNEKYVFDEANYNTSVATSKTYYNLNIVLKSSDVLSFKNATILDLGSDFSSNLFTASGAENSYLKAKITTSKSTASFFNKIPFSLFYKEDTSTAEATQITMEDYCKTMDDNARFATASSYDLATPIDVSKYRYMKFCLDNKSMVTIDLWVQRYQYSSSEITSDITVDSDGYLTTSYYLLWDNKGSTSAKDDYGTNKTTDASKYRDGIVQIINASIAELISTGDSSFASYEADTSYQYFNLCLTSTENSIESLSSDTYTMSLKVNDVIYTFTISNKTSYWTAVCSAMHPGLTIEYGAYSLKGIVDILNYVFTTNNGDDLKIYDPDTGTSSSPATGTYPLNKLTSEYLQVLNLNIDTDDDGDLDSVYDSYDLVIKNTSKDMLTTLTYTDVSSGFVHTLSDVIDLEDYSMTGYAMFIHTIKGNTSTSTSARWIIPDPIQAADYSTVAKMVDDGTSSSKSYFEIISPTIGSSSSIYFQKSDSSSGDFMKDYLLLSFNNSGFSYKAYGVKKAYLMKYDSLRSYTLSDGTESAISDTISAGNIIFENSCIYNNIDFSELYSNFKVSENSSLVLGSVYDNFYYSGDDDTDDLLKEDVSGVEGQYMTYSTLTSGVKSYSIDKSKSNFEIRLTSAAQDTNSLYAITSDLDVVECDRVKLLSADITENIGGAITFSIDDISDVTVDTGTCSSATDFIRLAIRALKNLDSTSDMYLNRSTIVSRSYQSINQVQLKNLTKEDGNITFKYSDGYIDTEVQKAYKVFLGTNKTNPELYTLYPSDMFKSDNIISVSTEEYYYCPTEDDPLKFTFRKLVENDSDDSDGRTESRAADYYISTEESSNGDQYSYRFSINKTENSKFPDSYFYVHFINDKTYDYDSSGKIKETDETVLQNYMYDYKISGTDIIFLKPYFKTYDVAATISYNTNYSESEVTESVNDAVDKVCDLSYAEIAGNMSRAKILKAIMNCDGVEDCKITYFGYDYSTTKNNSDTLTADFYEILCLHENVAGSHGKIFTFEAFN